MVNSANEQSEHQYKQACNPRGPTAGPVELDACRFLAEEGFDIWRESLRSLFDLDPAAEERLTGALRQTILGRWYKQPAAGWDKTDEPARPQQCLYTC